MHVLSFTDDLLQRRSPSSFDVDTTLDHFCILTYFVDIQAARKLIHPRFELVTVNHHGHDWALLSVVPFVDRDFHFIRFPSLKWQFSQTNYRIYVVDTQTNENVVWFIGTSLDSFAVNLPRYCWKLPWHSARIRFDCECDDTTSHYSRYSMTTSESWADASLEIHDTKLKPTHLIGFDDLETGLVVLTHPRIGFYSRRDGRLGTYSIWHERLHPTVGEVKSCRIDLLDRHGLATSSNTANVHSVLLQRSVQFTIYLPPTLAEPAIRMSS